jgi:flagellin-like protein
MKKLLKSKKALSPVVAAIILIAVTVAVSIAVAVWMGSLSFNFMSTEQLTITGVTFTPTNSSQIVAHVLNTGTVDVIISDATVTGNGVNSTSVAVPVPIGEGEQEDVTITITEGGWSATYLYNIEIVSTKGNVFAYSDTA